MSKELLLKQIMAMDVKSDEFIELYEAINEKYFTFENPDDFQSAAWALNAVLHRGEEWMVEMCARIANQLFDVIDKDTPASQISFGVKGKTWFCDIYRDKEALGSINKMFRNIVIQKANAQQATASEK